MNRTVLGLLFAVCSTGLLAAQMGAMNAPTYTKDVAPILQKHCQSCHRPGEAAPFSMLTYETTRPWAGAMKLAVRQKVMPPWYADPQVGHFSNDRSLTQEEINTIVAWSTAGAPQGRSKRLAVSGQLCGRLGHSKAGCDVSAAQRISSPRIGNGRVSICDRANGLHRRQMGSSSGSAAHRTFRGASHN